MQAIGCSPLTHASVGTVKSWFLDNPTGLELVSSCDIVKALFGIPGANPSPVDITDKLCHAAGDIAFRSMLVNKTIKGDIWEFTSDFGLTAIVSKLWHDSTGKFSYGISIKWNENQDGELACRVRPLVEYTARDIKYFVAEDSTIFKPEEETHDDNAQLAVSDSVQETADRATGPEEDPGTSSDSSMETLASADEEAREPMTSVYDIVDEEEEMEEIDMTVERIKAFAESLVTHLEESGPVTDDKVIAGFRMIFPDSEVVIERDLTGETAKENLQITVDDGTTKTAIDIKDWNPPKYPFTGEQLMTLGSLSCCVDSGLRVRDSNKLLAKAYELLKPGTIKDLVQFEDELSKFIDKDKKALVHIKDETLHIDVVDREEAESDAELVFPEGAFVSFDIGEAEDGPITIKGISIDRTAIVCDPELFHLVKPNTVYRVLFDITNGTIARFPSANEFFQLFAEEVKEEAAPTEDVKLTKVTVINNSSISSEELGLESFRDKLLKLIPLHDSVKSVERAMYDGARDDIHIYVSYDEANESWSVRIEDCIKDDKLESSEEEHMEETVKAEEIQEAMSSDKNTTPVTVDPNYIDLDDRETRDRVIQVLFPGVTDPAITHLLNFLRDYHTSEETKSFLETKGTIPTETCIVYTNLTFSIVKMKDGRYWRIFCANTDCGLDDPTWLATKYMHGRWHQLGHDISNTTDYVRENKNGPTWRRKNNNF